MRVRVASLYPMVDAAGPGLTRAETVTLFNDMFCVNVSEGSGPSR